MTLTKSMKLVADAITFAGQIEPSIRAKEHEVLHMRTEYLGKYGAGLNEINLPHGRQDTVVNPDGLETTDTVGSTVLGSKGQKYRRIFEVCLLRYDTYIRSSITRN